MPILRPIGRVRWLLGLTLGSSLLAGGCGDPGAPKTGKVVYSGPEEEAQKKQDLQDAMKGGAYGAAGRKAAGAMGGAAK